jgi:N6-adenosine-specific RNA methylase IME4
MFKRVEALDKSDKFMVKKAVSNVMISNVRGTSIKPFQMYEVIEALVPGCPYLDLFGRVHNRRHSWITAGNEAIALMKNMPGIYLV